MANLNFTYDTIGNWFFSFYESLETARAPKGFRREFALGVVTNIWTYCAMRNEPSFCATRDFVDTLLGAGAFDLMLDNKVVVTDGAGYRWTGPQFDPAWLLGSSEGEVGAVVTYVVRAGSDGHVKIGRTRNLTKRIDALQTGAAHQLVTLHEIAGDHEKHLHIACAAFRVQGEWFTPSDEFFAALRAAIDAIASSTV